MDAYQIGKDVYDISRRIELLERVVQELAVIVKTNVDNNILAKPKEV